MDFVFILNSSRTNFTDFYIVNFELSLSLNVLIFIHLNGKYVGLTIDIFALLNEFIALVFIYNLLIINCYLRPVLAKRF